MLGEMAEYQKTVQKINCGFVPYEVVHKTLYACSVMEEAWSRFRW